MGSPREDVEAAANREQALRFAAGSTERWSKARRGRNVSVRFAAESGASIDEIVTATALPERKVKQILLRRPLG